ncbi:PIG-L deacetylase family protein [Sinomonas sp. ASV322]|uniref:PIG-L deacetylase family protein n=1 Tax=Sinomonas sp. ASV322 TaxID=3041920 RepID=UPI0027DD4033|nr:PIG-L deacetylase family protein [Sinomonas sp. ASV322]MDQ4503287.1 PIG-L deacetylase family protein [Sinomonas sp. ASV322]
MADVQQIPDSARTPDGAVVRRVLAFGAHPDDLDFGAAGTIAAWAAAGAEIHYGIMTDGDAGGFDPDQRDEIVATRRDEQRSAAARVGAREVHFLGYRDGYLEPSHEVRRDVVRLIRTVRPDVVLSMHPERNWASLHMSHPDHLACGEAVTRAVYPAAENPFAYPELADGGLGAYRVPWLWLYGAPEGRINHTVDVTAHVEAKLEAIRVHLSQHSDFEATERYVRARLLATAASAGFAEGASGEGFHVVAVNAKDTIAGF